MSPPDYRRAARDHPDARRAGPGREGAARRPLPDQGKTKSVPTSVVVNVMSSVFGVSLGTLASSVYKPARGVSVVNPIVVRFAAYEANTGALAGTELTYAGVNGPNLYTREIPLAPSAMPIRIVGA